MQEFRNSNYEAWIDINKTLIEGELGKIIEDLMPGNSVIEQGIKYSVFNGGKRVRSILCIEIFKACKIFNKKLDKVLPVACAIELTHVNSLIQDDLPCMDNASLRRGKPTTHKKFGEANAILISDALGGLAFDAIFANRKISSSDKMKCYESLSETIGVEGLVGGQALDLMNENAEIDIETLQNIYMMKTGILFVAAGELACIVAKASRKKTDAIRKYTENIGLAFQIIDDILDVKSNEDILGKNIGLDKMKNKTTFPSLIGVEKSIELVNQLTETAIESLKIFGNKAEFLIEFAHRLASRDY